MLDLLFPCTILKEQIIDATSINNQLKSVINDVMSTIPSGGSGWIGRPYNTCGTWDITKDERFNTITTRVTDVVKQYYYELGVDVKKNPPICEEGWLNVYSVSDFQEYHIHEEFRASVVYYVDTSPGSTLVFEPPYIDMKPLVTTVASTLTNRRVDVSVEPGDAIVFRSFLRHCVPPLKEEGTRISLAFNFN